MRDSEVVLLILWFTGFFGFWFWIDRRWAVSRLKAWALGEKLTLLRGERRYMARGPFGLLGQYQVFRIHVRDGSGTERRGWVRLGGFFNVWSDTMEARWDPLN